MEDQSKIELFEQIPIPRAVAAMSIPTIISSLVMVLYNLADTYFVGMLNDPIENSAVTLAAPVLLAFNAVNNLFGVGSSSMMSRAMGRKDWTKARCKRNRANTVPCCSMPFIWGLRWSYLGSNNHKHFNPSSCVICSLCSFVFGTFSFL